MVRLGQARSNIPINYINSMDLAIQASDVQDGQLYQKGVKHLYENGVTGLPNKYILPVHERPNNNETKSSKCNLSLPIIDFSQINGSNRAPVVKSIADACKQYGFFQLINHGISVDVLKDMIDVSTRFFDQPFNERAKYMSSDVLSPVRYGTSFNQNKDRVFYWRDFLKFICHPMSRFQSRCPSSPLGFGSVAATYASETRNLFVVLMEAILEGLGVVSHLDGKTGEEEDSEERHDHGGDNGSSGGGYNDETWEKVKDGSQIIVVNCYPPCPEPNLTLGMPPHSDYGSLTLLLQDGVEGLQIQHQGTWVTVDCIANAFVVNVGDHLEIFSNGRYKSVVHRVLANPMKSRISVASLHSLPFECKIRPSSKLINEDNPRRYKDTDFAAFLAYMTTREPQEKEFLESRILT